MSKGKRKTLVLGMGETGFSVARYLSKHDDPFIMADSHPTPAKLDLFHESFPGLELHLGARDLSLLSGSSEVIVSPGVPPSHPIVQAARLQGLPVYGDVELFARKLPSDKQVVAITGTNGKSTVTALVARMADCAGRSVLAGGNVGVPALDLLDHQETELYVLELSSFQLETLSSLQPAVSTILNISADHLDRYDSFEHYAQTKQRIYQGSEAIVVNREEPACRQALPEKAKTIAYGLGAGAEDDFGLVEIDGEACIVQREESWIAEGEMNGLPGKTGLLNAQAALAIGVMADLPRPAMLETLRNFTGLPHRLQLLGYHRGVMWINDSKATNVAAATAALESVDRPCLWIAGGDGKQADFSALSSVVRGRVRAAFFIGKDAPALLASTEELVAAEIAGTLQQAVQRAAELGRPGDCVLLSPACSSLDCYRNYEQRGDHFIKLFSELAA